MDPFKGTIAWYNDSNGFNISYLILTSSSTAATMEPIPGTQPKDMMGATPTMDGQVGAAANQQVHTVWI